MNFIPVSIYRTIFSCSYPTLAFLFFVFASFFVLLVFYANFQFLGSLFPLQFQHLLDVLLAFLGNFV